MINVFPEKWFTSFSWKSFTWNMSQLNLGKVNCRKLSFKVQLGNWIHSKALCGQYLVSLRFIISHIYWYCINIVLLPLLYCISISFNQDQQKQQQGDEEAGGSHISAMTTLHADSRLCYQLQGTNCVSFKAR